MPPAVAVTLTDTEQVLLDGIDPPASFKLVLPVASAAPAASVTVDPQVLLLMVADASVKPDGNVSIKLVMVRAVELGLLSWITIGTELPAAALATGAIIVPNALLTDGCPTDKVATPAIVFDPKPAVVNAPMGMVLTLLPTTVERTLTVIEQVPPGLIEPPVKRTPVSFVVKAPPAAFVSVPPQVLVEVLLTSVMPAGKLSVTFAPVIGTLLGLLIAIVNTLVAETPTTGGKNPLLISGATTVMVALAAAALDPPLVSNAPAGMVLS